MNRLTAIALFAIANVALVGNSLAQSQTVHAKVPFDFTVSNSLLPAGTYSINPASPSLLLFRNRDKPVAAFSLVTPGNGNVPHHEKLIFHKYGNQYFLSALESESAGMSVNVPSSRQEKQVKELEANKGQTTQIFVATKR